MIIIIRMIQMKILLNTFTIAAAAVDATTTTSFSHHLLEEKSRHNNNSCVGQVVSTLAFGTDDPGFKSRWGRRKRIFISLLLSSASEGTVSRRSSRPRALVARVSCNLYTDLKQRLHLHL